MVKPSGPPPRNENSLLLNDRTDMRGSGAVQGRGHRKAYSVDISTAASTAERDPRFGGLARHRQTQSSISEWLLHQQEALAPITEELQTTTKYMARSMVKSYVNMDRTGYLDMGMTRSLSILPDDLVGAWDEVIPEDLPAKLAAEEGIPLVQYLLLLSAVAAVSSNSTALHMLDGVAPPLKLFWRMTASYMALTPLVLRHLYLEHAAKKNSRPEGSVSDGTSSNYSAVEEDAYLAHDTFADEQHNYERSETASTTATTTPDLSPVTLILSFFAASAAYTAHACLFITALEYTTIGNALIFANSQALLLIVGRAITGQVIHPLEGVGVVIAFGGAILCSTEHDEGGKENHDQEDDAKRAFYGDFLALLSAVTGVTYLTFAKAVRSSLSVNVFMWCNMFFGSWMVLGYLCLTSHGNLDWSMNKYQGVWGWFDSSRFPVLVYLAVVCNMVGTMGFVRAMAFFDNVIIAVATLTEPLMASFIAFAFHVGSLPGFWGWIGNFLVVAGTMVVALPSMGKGGGGGMH